MSTVDRKQFAAGAAAVFASINVVRAPAKAAEFEYKFATNEPIGGPRNTNAVAMWERVKKATNGRLNVTVYPNSVLGSDTSMLSQVRSGAIQFFAISGASLSIVVPVAAIVDVPFAFSTAERGFAACDGGLGAYIRKEIEAKGLLTFPHSLDNGFRQITSSKGPVRTVDDLPGLKIRTPPTKLIVDFFSSLGAQPTPISFNEVYTALQTHIVDGQENAYVIIEIGKLFEVQKYLSVTNHIWDTHWVVINPDAWKALPADIQTLVMRESLTYARDQRRDNTLQNAALAEKLGRQGMTINTTDVATFKPKLKDFYARWKVEFGSAAWDALTQYSGPLT